MDKNTILGLLLIIAIIFGFNYFNKSNSSEQIQQQNVTQNVKNTGSADIHNISTSDSLINDSLCTKPYLRKKEIKQIKLSNNLVDIKISNKGGVPVSAQLLKHKDKDGRNVVLFSDNDIHINFPIKTNNNEEINTSECYFDVVSASDSSVVMRLQFSEDSFLDFRYTLPKDDYRISMDISGQNLKNILPSNMTLQDIQWQQKIRRQEDSWKFEHQYTGIYYHFTSGDVESFDMSKNDSKHIGERTDWISFKDKYFSTLVLSKRNAFENSNIKVKSAQENDSKYIGNCEYSGSVPFDFRENTEINLIWMFMPNDYELLSQYSKTTVVDKDFRLQHLVYLGWSFFRAINKYLIIPVVLFLNKYIDNWGIIILLLTLFIKTILSPLTFKSYMSQAKMRVLKPEVDAIKNKYPGTDRETMMKRQTETMNLYKSAGASPMSGCLPMLLQMPFFIALYMYFPTSILLRGESFLWVKDLSTYDGVISWSGNIPIISSVLGNHISIMCLLMTITNIAYNKYMMNQNQSSQEGMPSMKWMPYIMSIMFFFMFNNNASGLCYYYFISSLITIIQYFAFRYTINEDKLRAKIEENKKKPKKKSAFMQRLEEAQRMQREMQKQKNKKK